jgi:hypothetical protein
MIHIIPINDEREHDELTSCWCEPKLITDEPEMIVVHRAADGRELVEEAEAIKEAAQS